MSTQQPNVGDVGTGKTRLLSRRCDSCILRRGGLALPPGRVNEFVEQTRQAESFVVCHETLPGFSPPGVEPAVCRGFADRYDTNSLRVIRRLWGFREVPPPDAT